VQNAIVDDIINVYTSSISQMTFEGKERMSAHRSPNLAPSGGRSAFCHNRYSCSCKRMRTKQRVGGKTTKLLTIYYLTVFLYPSVNRIRISKTLKNVTRLSCMHCEKIWCELLIAFCYYDGNTFYLA
jgi:hypothetical protein